MARILIVDDCPLQRAVSLKVVQALGHTGIVCSDGQAGVEAAMRERPDLVLMDVVMPGIDGYAATRTLCNHPGLRDMPIVLVTGKSQPTDCEWGLRPGAAGYATMPVRSDALVAARFGREGRRHRERRAD